MGHSDLKIRTKDYALAVIRLFAEFPKRTEAQIMGRELLASHDHGSIGEFRKSDWPLSKKETGELKGIFVSVVVNTKAKSQSPKR